MKLALCSLAFLGSLALAAEPPLTVAEKSEYKATSRYADVLQFCEALAKQSPRVRLGELGTSSEGRKLPLVIIADPPVATAAEAAKSGKLVVFALGNIHAGEVDGKEALLMLARDFALAPEPGILRDLVLVFAPIFNADGNERIDTNNRRTQNGPADGVGIRANAQGFDLNRDFVKLESPEVRSLVRFLNEWDPGILIDCHTTNGSYHRYALTYEGGRCPAGSEKVIEFTRGLLPQVSSRLEKSTGYRSYFYGNFNAERTRWDTVEPTPRYGTHYVGLRNRIAILSESYSYASYKDRVLATRGFVETICKLAAEQRPEIAKLLQEARAQSTAAGRNPQPTDRVVIRQENAPLGRPFALPGYVEERKDDRRVATQQHKDYEVTYWGGTRPVLAVQRPFAYLLPESFKEVIANLQRHGIAVERLREPADLTVESYRIEKLTRLNAFQKHQPITLEVTAQSQRKKLETGTVVIRTGQPLGSLAVYLLEPHSADGLATWNFFDAVIKEGEEFPVVRLPKPAELVTEALKLEGEKQP